MSGQKTKGGSGNKKMKKYPRILDYLEVHYKDVYDLIDDLAMHGALTPKRGGSITFLIPDKSYIAKIRKTIESDKPEEATDMIGSLILLDLFESGKDISDKKDDIPNLLGKKLEVKSITGNKATIDNGEITLNTGFKPFDRQGSSKRGNLAVWDLKGEVNYQTASKSSFKYAKVFTGGPKKEGGTEVAGKRCAEIIDEVIKAELKAINESARTNTGTFVSPIVRVVAGVLKDFKDKKDNTYRDEYLIARSVLTKHPIIDFYLLFSTPYLFNQNKLSQTYFNSKNDSSDKDVDIIKNFFKDYTGDGAVLNNNVELNKIRDSLRIEVTGISSLSLQKDIIKIYEDLDNTNSYIYKERVCISNVYPEILHNIFRSKSSSNFHLVLDECKYFIYSCYKNISNSFPIGIGNLGKEGRVRAYTELFSLMKDNFSKLGCCKTSLVLREVLDNSDRELIKNFWNSFGLHTPVDDTSALDQRVTIGGDDYLDDYSGDLADVDEEINSDLNKYDNSDFTITDSAKKQLKHYVKKHGRGELDKLLEEE